MVNKLDEIVKSKNVSIKDMINKTGVDKGNYYKYKNGEVNPSLSTAIALSRYLETPVEEIWEL